MGKGKGGDVIFFFGFGAVWMGVRLESEEAADSGLGEFTEHGFGVLACG